MTKRATLAQVAAYAGVSIATASRAFSDPTLVRPETIAIIRQAAVALHYKAPRILERNLSMARIAVFTRLFHRHGELERLRGISNALRPWPHELLLYDVDDSLASIDYVKKLVVTKRIEGVIFSGVPVAPEVAIYLKRFQIPSVLIDNDDARFSRVFTSDKKGSELAADFFNKSKSSKILLLGARPTALDLHPGIRLQSFREHLDPKKRLASAELLVAPTSGEAVSEIRKILTAKKPPDAIFADSDLLAMTVIFLARELTISIPGDCSLIGYGDTDTAEILGITSVRTHLDASGRRSVEILRSTEEFGQITRHELEPELIIRSTT